MHLVPRDHARHQGVDGAHVPVFVPPHAVEVGAWAVAGRPGHRESAAGGHEQVRVVERRDRAVDVAGVEGGEEVEHRPARPRDDLRPLVGPEILGLAGRGPKLDGPAVVPPGHDVEDPRRAIGRAVGAVAAEADRRVHLLGRRPEHRVRVEVERAAAPPLARPHLVEAGREVLRPVVRDQRPAARHRRERKVHGPAQVRIVGGVPLRDERLKRLTRGRLRGLAPCRRIPGLGRAGRRNHQQAQGQNRYRAEIGGHHGYRLGRP